MKLEYIHLGCPCVSEQFDSTEALDRPDQSWPTRSPGYPHTCRRCWSRPTGEVELPRGRPRGDTERGEKYLAFIWIRNDQ